MIDILIFGTGKSCENLLLRLDYNLVNILAFVDNDSTKAYKKYYDKLIIPPTEINTYNFTFIIIASMYEDEIVMQLQSIGVSKQKIISISKHDYINEYMGRIECLEKIIGDLNKYNSYEMIITGLSYAQGIQTENLKLKTMNFALPSQDLFFDYCIAKYFLNVKKDKFQNVRKVIIGLSYYSFEYDLLKSSQHILVLRYNKYMPEIKNIVASISKEKLIQYQNIILKYENFDKKYKTLNKIIAKTQINEYVTRELQITKTDRKRIAELHSNKNYPKTVHENRLILEEYLQLLQQNNISAIVVVHPQHKDYRKYFSNRISLQFHNIIMEMQEKYDFELIDYYSSNLFDDDDYFDTHHLGRGREKFSKILNEIICY